MLFTPAPVLATIRHAITPPLLSAILLQGVHCPFGGGFTRPVKDDLFQQGVLT